MQVTKYIMLSFALPLLKIKISQFIVFCLISLQLVKCNQWYHFRNIIKIVMISHHLSCNHYNSSVWKCNHYNSCLWCDITSLISIIPVFVWFHLDKIIISNSLVLVWYHFNRVNCSIVFIFGPVWFHLSHIVSILEIDMILKLLPV